MFVGHYGPAFAAKALRRSIPLWLLFIAVQFVDVLWAIFVLLGIEKVRIVPGITATNPLDLYYMPYTHSLLAAFLWSGAVVAVCRALPPLNSWSTAGIIGAAVFSHWILDLPVHRPDLSLYDSAYKMGLGLWDFPTIAFGLEAALLFGGVYLYMRNTKVVARGGRYGVLTFGVVMLLIQAYVFFGPPPASDKTAAVTALMSYFLFAGVAYWLDGKRAPLD